MERKEVIENLLKEGATMTKNLKVRNVTVRPLENYVRLALTLDKPVKGMVQNEDGTTYEEEEVKVIFVSLYSIISLLKDNEDAAFAANYILENPNSVSVILSGATIDVISEPVAAGVAYTNPWSDNPEETIFDHDTVIQHVVKLDITGKIALIGLQKIAEKLLGLND